MIKVFKMFTLALCLNSVAYAQPKDIKRKFGTKQNTDQCPGQNMSIAKETLTTATNQGIEYCRMLSAALKGKEGALYLFSLLPFDAAAAIGHGVTLLDVVKAVGEKKYLESIKARPKAVYPVILQNLEAGASYSNEFGNKKTLKEIFPDTFSYLKS